MSISDVNGNVSVYHRTGTIVLLLRASDLPKLLESRSMPTIRSKRAGERTVVGGTETFAKSCGAQTESDAKSVMS